MRDLVEKYEGIEPLADEWRELAIRNDMPPFVRPGWLAAWSDSFSDSELTLFASRRDGRLTGVLPVVEEGPVMRSPTNWHSHEFEPVAIDNDAGLALFEAAIAEHPRRLDLSFLPVDSVPEELMNRVAPEYRVDSEVVSRSPYVAIEGDWESYWAQRSRKLRSTVRRCRRRLESLGEVTVDVYDGRDGNLTSLLEEAFRLEASGWKGEDGTAIASAENTCHFYRDVASWAVEWGLLDMTFLRVDGRAVAFQFSLKVSNRYYGLKIGHDAALSRCGPGTVLAAETFARCFEERVKSFEMLGDADPHKMRWTDQCRERVHLQAFAPTVAGTVDRLWDTHARNAARRLLRRA